MPYREIKYKKSCWIIAIILISEVSASLNKLTIKTEEGDNYPMDYLAPQPFQTGPRDIEQQSPGDIGPINVEAVKEFLNARQYRNINIAAALYEIVDANLTYQAEYYYYNSKYNLDKEREELPLCIVSPFYNFFARQSWKRFLECLEHQNYTNFQVIMNDDMSTDNSAEKIINIVEQEYPRLKKRLTILKNQEYIQMMGNHDISIRNYCKPGTIIVEVDGDDFLLGRQVFKLLNAQYQDYPHLWIIYANMLLKIGRSGYNKFGNAEIPKTIFDRNGYRTSGRWMTSHLKSYRRQVYMKIPNQYFERKPGKYFLYAADLFNIVAIIELSGRSHTRYLDQCLYYYRMGNGKCSARLNVVAQKLSRMKTPFLPLQSLQSKAQYTPNYTTPEYMIQMYNKRVETTYKCIVDLRQKINDPTYMQKI